MEAVMILGTLFAAHHYYHQNEVVVDDAKHIAQEYEVEWKSAGNFIATQGDVKWVVITDD